MGTNHEARYYQASNRKLLPVIKMMMTRGTKTNFAFSGRKFFGQPANDVWTFRWDVSMIQPHMSSLNRSLMTFKALGSRMTHRSVAADHEAASLVLFTWVNIEKAWVRTYDGVFSNSSFRHQKYSKSKNSPLKVIRPFALVCFSLQFEKWRRLLHYSPCATEFETVTFCCGTQI